MLDQLDHPIPPIQIHQVYRNQRAHRVNSWGRQEPDSIFVTGLTNFRRIRRSGSHSYGRHCAQAQKGFPRPIENADRRRHPDFSSRILADRKPTPTGDEPLARNSKDFKATVFHRAFLIQLLAAAHDEIRDHDEETDTRDGPDNRNVFHDGLLSEAIAVLNKLPS
jgi:hypothetical protein